MDFFSMRQIATLLCLALSSIALVSSWTTSLSLSSTRLQFARKVKQDGYNDVLVVSPPGGVGEVAAVKAAEMGKSVRWFVVSQDAGESNVLIAQEILDRISSAGGSFDVAGASASSVMLSRDDKESSLGAISTWCGSSSSLIVCCDGVADNRKRNDQDDPTVSWNNAIKLATKEVAQLVSGTKIAILSASDDIDDENSNNLESDKGIDIVDIVSGLVGGRRNDIPVSITEAMGESNLIRLRYGQLFGIPESSPEFSPFVGGPRRQPELCPEYTFASVRVDSTIALSGNRMTGTRSSRHAVGQAAALLATGQITLSEIQSIDVCVSSQPGTSQMTLDEWRSEFERVEKMMKSGQAALLFETEYSSVPDVDRLADWLLMKWAPTVLRTYDIASIRTGARPVYANRVDSDETAIEILWQQLVNFESVIAGKVIIHVTQTGIKAIRGAGDAKAGFGSVSSKPLQGEDVLVRRLAEAASQAIEKGLAVKMAPKKLSITPSFPQPITTVVSSIESSGTVVSAQQKQSASSGSKPSGARRSTERVRGTKRKAPESSS